jgi:FtsP/CotA-like multicopper oxidase with cupredoxin domain
MNRRRFLLAGAAGAGALFLPGIATPRSAAEPRILEARTGIARLLEAGAPQTVIWGYDGVTPGPVLRARQGEEVWVRLVNLLPEPTTIHWHGIRLDNAMDGVAHLTQEPVAQGESFDYRFRVPDAGTYWYHPHVHGSGPQVERGLAGALIVEETVPVDVDRDIVLVVKDWRLDEDGAIHEASFGNLHDAAHAGRLGNILTVNGRHLEQVAVRAGERVRLRFVSAANSRVMKFDLEGHDPWLVALDGQPVEPLRLGRAPVVLAPSQRADLIVDMTGEPGSRAAIREVTEEPFQAAELVYRAGPGRPAREAPPVQLPANPVPLPAASNPREVDLVMTGGAMRPLGSGLYRGEVLGGRKLALEHGMVWAFNDVAGMPEAPLFTATRDQEIALRIVNDTMWPHAIHVHGHHFVELSRNGGPPDPGLRDTVLLEREEEVVVAFVADNPGRWMIHCHMLEHQHSGMESWFEVLI